MENEARDGKPEWKLVTEYGVSEYECGLVAGDHVRLKRDLRIRDWEGRLTGEVHPAGEVWLVLPGATQDPGVVWFLQPDGKRHTWPDSSEVWEWFEKV